MKDVKAAPPPATRGPFSAADAAFTGFRVLRREPVTGAIWAAAMLGMGLVFGALAVLLAGSAMGELMQRAGDPQSDPAAAAALMGRLAPFYFVVFILSFLFYAVAISAVTRAVLRPDEPRGFGRLRLGGDELRMLGVLLLFAVVSFAAYVVLVILAVIVGVVGGVAVGLSAASAGGGAAAGGVVLMTILIGLAVFAGMAFLTVRLSLACPLTFDTGQVDLFGSWRLTKGRFWPLFGAYALCFLLALVLTLAAFMIMAVLGLVLGGGLAAAGVMFRPDTSSLGAYFAPLMLLWFVISSALNTVVLAMLFAAPAGAYAQLRTAAGTTAVIPPTRGF